MLPLKRVTDKDYLLCHKCGQRLNGVAHRHCAEAARRESGMMGKESPKPSRIKHAVRTRPFEGIGTIGHTPCRLDDGSLIIPAEEARKVREKGFICAQTGMRYGPWTNGRFRERKRVIGRKRTEEDEEEALEEVEVDDWYDDDETEDLFSLAHGYSSKIYISKVIPARKKQKIVFSGMFPAVYNS